MNDIYYTVYTLADNSRYCICATSKVYFDKHHCVSDHHMARLEDALAQIDIYNECEGEFEIENFAIFDEAKMILSMRNAGFNMIRNDTINDPVKAAYGLKTIPIQKNAQNLMANP